MALSEPSIEKENSKQKTEEKLDGIDEGNVQVITGPTEIEGSGSDNENGVKACLLYTSPSPRDATLSRMPSSA